MPSVCTVAASRAVCPARAQTGPAVPLHHAKTGRARRTCGRNVCGGCTRVIDALQLVDIAAGGAGSGLRQRLAGEPCTATPSTCQHCVGGLLFAGHAHAHGCHDQPYGGLLQQGCTGRLLQTADTHQHTARSTGWPRQYAALYPCCWLSMLTGSIRMWLFCCTVRKLLDQSRVSLS
jgi:hypothetical protein